jgi:uncharacterized membrane protein
MTAVLVGASVVCAVVGVIMRWWPRGALWLDEAQSVAFARLPMHSIPGALRQDGAPPLYYELLHVWMRVFGDGKSFPKHSRDQFCRITRGAWK